MWLNLEEVADEMEKVVWNYFTTSSGVLWIQWNLRVEVGEKHQLQAEIEKMKDCVGQMYERRVVLFIMFIDAPRGVGGYQGTGSVCKLRLRESRMKLTYRNRPFGRGSRNTYRMGIQQ